MVVTNNVATAWWQVQTAGGIWHVARIWVCTLVPYGVVQIRRCQK